MVHLSKMRENHLEYSSELARYSNEVTTTYKETPRTDAENKSLTDLALRGLHLLSDWTCVVTELTSWKLLHPTDHHQNNDCPSEVKPNYFKKWTLKIQKSEIIVLVLNQSPISAAFTIVRFAGDLKTALTGDPLESF